MVACAGKKSSNIRISIQTGRVITGPDKWLFITAGILLIAPEVVFVVLMYVSFAMILLVRLGQTKDSPLQFWHLTFIFGA